MEREEDVGTVVAVVARDADDALAQGAVGTDGHLASSLEDRVAADPRPGPDGGPGNAKVHIV